MKTKDKLMKVMMPKQLKPIIKAPSQDVPNSQKTLAALCHAGV